MRSDLALGLSLWLVVSLMLAITLGAWWQAGMP